MRIIIKYNAGSYGAKLIEDLLGKDKSFSFPKSLYTVKDAINSVVYNKKEAIVLDYHAGSGTTGHAVLELNKEDGGNRKFILCEQMDYIETVTRERVRKVIHNNNQGSFVYCELAKANQNFVDQIEAAATKEQLDAIWEQMQQSGFLSWKISPKTISAEAKAFADLTVDDTRRLLIESLDKNLLYIPLTEIDNQEFAISNHDKQLNTQFYGGK